MVILRHYASRSAGASALLPKRRQGRMIGSSNLWISWQKLVACNVP